MERIFLIGYMGAGKTTIGKALSRTLRVDFIDLDKYIQDTHQKSIHQLFEEKGEEGFRKIERKALHEVSAFEDIVISCGGGTPCFFR
jgi:shikimate kinase